jgi:hypothetical protein
MSNIVTFSGSNLPSVSTLATTLRSLEREVAPTGTVFLKMDKTGHWVYGSDQTEVEDGSTWAVNPFSFIHGFIAWGPGEMLGEKMVPLSQPLPDCGDAPPGSKKGWEPQLGVSLKCMSGEDEGLEVRYTATSKGGREAIQKLGLAIAEQVAKDQTKPVAVIALAKEHYTHREFGRIYTPLLEVKSWVSLDGSADTPKLEDAAPTEEPEAPRRRRRASAE